MESRNSFNVLSDIKKLVNQTGYIYTLCLIIIDDFHYNLEEMHEINNYERLNKNEVSLLIGFLIQNEINLKTPNSHTELLNQKKETYNLMKELQHSFIQPFYDRFNNFDLKSIPEKKDFFGGENQFIEPIFYSGDGIYDFQYLEFLEKKYKYDSEWLKNNKKFCFDKVIKITNQIKSLHNDKIKKINFLGLRENKEKIIKNLKKSSLKSEKISQEKIIEILESLEFFQFYELFKTEKHIDKGLNNNEISKKGWESFYKGLLDLFIIQKSDFSEELDFSSFLKNFSISIEKSGTNHQFQNIGDFNIFASKPIISLGSNKYFVPISFSIFEAVYESPFYWMMEDINYKDKLAENRGNSGEEITYDLLKKVFGENRVFKSVRIESKKGYNDTDIDVLCILGSKALCVQVKSKKLTQISRKGNFSQLQKDFKAAVQDAYIQGLISRSRIIEKKAVFYDENSKPIKLSEDINEVYILGVTTENYPALTHQSFTLLEKKESDPYPLILTVFDLELVLFYLNNPYDFLYYVRQRISLMDNFIANEEMHYLGYHLLKKLWKDSNYEVVTIDNSIGQLIDRNYYPLKSNIKTSSKNDKIQNRWKNHEFESLCKQIDELNFPKSTDIIFHLLDWSQESRDNLINQIKITKSKTLSDGEWHNLSILSGPKISKFGLTFVSWPNNNISELSNSLFNLCSARKYKSKADIWIGIGCLRDSGRIVDTIAFSESDWKYNEEKEKEIKEMFEGKNQGNYVKFGKKIGRNDSCSCGSGIKYKKCCGRNI